MHSTQTKALICLSVLFGILSMGAAAADNNKADDSTSSKKINNLAEKSMLSQSDLKSPIAVTPDQEVEDIDKIHNELKQIIARTQKLQNQVHDDRNEIKDILERAQIHQRILKGITIPKPIQSKQQINQDDILAREKMRLIAQQAYQTQQQLKALQSSRFAGSVSKVDSSQAS